MSFLSSLESSRAAKIIGVVGFQVCHEERGDYNFGNLTNVFTYGNGRGVDFSSIGSLDFQT